jgi:hypothetical protein
MLHVIDELPSKNGPVRRDQTAVAVHFTVVRRSINVYLTAFAVFEPSDEGPDVVRAIYLDQSTLAVGFVRAPLALVQRSVRENGFTNPVSYRPVPGPRVPIPVGSQLRLLGLSRHTVGKMGDGELPNLHLNLADKWVKYRLWNRFLGPG